MTVNIWLALRDDAQAMIIERLMWDEESQGPYSGPITDRQNKIFSYMSDHENTQRLFRKASMAGRVWTVWSVYFDLPGDVLSIVKDELDQLTIDYPTRIKIVGAWRWDGRQVGTNFVYDVDGSIIGTSGVPTYPLHAQLMLFIPDVWNGDEPPTYSSATELTDVNLLMGQSPRRFS